MQSSVDDRDLAPSNTWWYRFFMRVPVRYLILPIGKKMFKIKTERYKGEFPSRPFIMIFNHATDYDFIGTIQIIPEYGRYIMSDELIKKAWRRTIIMTATNGIYRRKGENANRVVEAVKQTLDQGINVYLAAEGEESANGVTAAIRKRTGQMIKDMGVSVVTCKLEGGYLIKPKWADNKSKGPMFGRLVNTYSKEELAKLTPDEINDLIAKDLYFNVYDWQKEHHIPYDRKNRAERMEKILFRCPKCESMCKLKSEKDDLFCTECGYRVSVDECGLFVGDDLRFDNLCDWDLWQKECLKKELPNWEANPDMVIASDHGCELKKMNGNDTEILDTDVTVEMTYNDIIIKGEHTDMRMPLKELEGLASVRNGIGVSYQGQYYKVITAQYHTCMMRYRTIRRIIMGRTDL